MRPLLYVLACLLAVLLAAGTLLADGCPTPGRVVVSRPVYSAPAVVVKPVVVAPVKKVVVEDVPVVVRFTAVVPLVEYGSYSAVYAPPSPLSAPGQAPLQAQPLAQQSEMAKIAAALETISKRLDRLEAQQPKQQQAPQTPQAQQQAPTPLAVVQQKCSGCHGKDGAAEKGAGLVLFAEGRLAPVSARQGNRVIARSYAGTMPPKDSGLTLSDADVAAIVAHYANAK